MAELQYLMAQTHDLARRQLGKAVKRQMRNYDKRAELQVIPVGSEVYLYAPGKKVGRSPKLQCQWSGPWTVETHVGGPVYQIVQGRKRRVVH